MELYILESNIYLDMPSKKEVTIGITINLDNYENIRLEVEGDAETREDVENLILFLDGILARLGRGDPATAERVDAPAAGSLGGTDGTGRQPEEVSAKYPNPKSVKTDQRLRQSRWRGRNRSPTGQNPPHASNRNARNLADPRKIPENRKKSRRLSLHLPR